MAKQKSVKVMTFERLPKGKKFRIKYPREKSQIGSFIKLRRNLCEYPATTAYNSVKLNTPGAGNPLTVRHDDFVVQL